MAGRKFIEAVKNIGTEKIKEMYTKKLSQIMEYPDVQDKQAMAAAAILVAEDIATDYIFNDDSGLTMQELIPLLSSKKQISVNERAYETIIEWVASNANRFESNTSTVGKAENQGCQYGVIEDGWAYIINSYFNDEMTKRGYNSKAVLHGLRKSGLIKTTTEKNITRNTVRKTINKTQVTCVAVCLSDEFETETGIFDL
jgi:hypothetical protein